MSARNIKKLNLEVCTTYWTQWTHCAAWGEGKSTQEEEGKKTVNQRSLKSHLFLH